jgi:arsenite-transporting ATPase
VPELAFFVGKGGVGKTTLSAAYAIRRALKDPGGRTMLISTDPAHSLADILQIKLSDSPANMPLRARTKLIAWQMNSAKLFRSFIGHHKPHILEIIDRGSLFTAEEISPLLDTTLPGMSEIAALMAIQDAIESGKYSTIVVDTAPFGHTLRLFSLPEQFAKLLNFLKLAASRDEVLAAHFGGRSSFATIPFLQEWQLKVETLQRSFSAAQLFLVTTAEKFALNESVRCLEELKKADVGVTVGAVILNRVIRNPTSCSSCRRKAEAARAARSLLKDKYGSARLYVADDPGFPILGARVLERFAEHVFSGTAFKAKAHFPEAKAKTKPQFAFTAVQWPKLQAPLSFVLGKGGVGKTTISAGLGFSCRERSKVPVEICSVDPAPSLDDIFLTPVSDRPKPVLGDPKFRASELDAVSLFQSWIGEIRGEIDDATTGDYSGVHVDLSFERRLFSELLEIVPPGLDEVLAIFRIVEMLDGPARKIIIDMAPTGHALELLRMPGNILAWSRLLLKSLAAHRKLALARNAAVKIAELEMHARQLSAALKNRKQVAIFSVMLPELLPDRETERLLGELQDMGLAADTVFVNRVIFPETAENCRRCQLAVRWQANVLSELRHRYPKKDIYVVRNFDNEIAGRKGLLSLTGELWRLN